MPLRIPAIKPIVQRTWDMAARYVKTLTWLTKDGMRFTGWRVFLIVGLSVIGVLTAASSYGIILMYARSVQVGKPMRVYRATLPVDGEWWAVTIVAGATVVMGLISGFAEYYSELIIQRITQRYETFCSLRALSLFSANRLDLSYRSAGRGVRGEVARLAQGAARYTAYAYRFILRLIMPVITLGFATAFMLWKDASLSLLLLPPLLLYIPLLGIVNRQIARYHKEFRNGNRELRPLVRRTIDHIGTSSDSPVTQDEAWRDLLYDTEAFRRTTSRFYDRILARDKVHLLNSLFFVAILVLLFSYAVATVDTDNTAWANLVAFLVALRFVWRSLSKSTATLTSISRFFPEFKDYAVAVQGGYGPLAELSEELRSPHVQIRCKQRLTTSKECGAIDLSPGDVCLMLTSDEFDRLTVLEYLSAAIHWPEDISSLGQLVSMQGFPYYLEYIPMEVMAIGFEPTDEQRRQFSHWLDNLQITDEYEKASQTEAQQGGQDAWDQLTPEGRMAIAAAHCALSGRGFIVFYGRPLSALDPTFVERLLDSLQDRVILVYDHSPSSYLSERATRQPDSVVALQNGRPIGCGDMEWYNANMEAIVEATSRQVTATGEDAGDILDQEEEDA